jgi:hypothetical protein
MNIKTKAMLYTLRDIASAIALFCLLASLLVLWIYLALNVHHMFLLIAFMPIVVVLIRQVYMKHLKNLEHLES